jgi:predicted permease
MAESDNGLLVEAILVSVSANAQVLVIVLSGVYAAHRRMIDREVLVKMSTVVLRIGFPCLAFSMLASYDAERVRAWSPVLLVALCVQALGGLLGLAAAKLLCLAPPEKQLLVLSTTYGNNGALPFVLTYPVREPPTPRLYHRISRLLVPHAPPSTPPSCAPSDAALCSQVTTMWSRAKESDDPQGVALAVIGLYVSTWFISFSSAGKTCVAITAFRPARSAPHVRPPPFTPHVRPPPLPRAACTLQVCRVHSPRVVRPAARGG